MDPENLRTDDEEIVQPEDPDAQYLVDDGPEETDEEKAEREAREAAERAHPAIDDETQAILTQLRKNPEAIQRLLNPPQQQPQQQQTQQTQPFDPEAFATAFEEDLLRDPKVAARKLLGAVSNVVQQVREQTLNEVQQQYGSVASSQVDNAIDTFFERSRTDPMMDDEVRSEMGRIIDDAKKTNGAAIARMNRSQVMAALEAVKAQAVGAVTIKRASTRRKTAAQPPNYGSTSNARPTNRTAALTEDERGLIRGLESAGMSKKDITEALKEYRAENRRSA
jgi:hypothetical protein